MKKGKAGRGISVLTTYRYRRVAASTIPLIEESPFEPRFLFLSIFFSLLFFFYSPTGEIAIRGSEKIGCEDW